MDLTGLHVVSDIIEELGYKQVTGSKAMHKVGAGQYKIYERYVRYCPSAVSTRKRFAYIRAKGQILHVHGAGICIFINLACPDSLDQLRQAIIASEESVGNSVSP